MTIQRPEGEQYAHGYHQAVIGFYARRTAEDCAAGLLQRLRSDAVVLDMGCGPGTITTGLAHRASRVIGLDPAAEMGDEARSRAAGKPASLVRAVQMSSRGITGSVNTSRSVSIPGSAVRAKLR